LFNLSSLIDCQRYIFNINKCTAEEIRKVKFLTLTVLGIDGISKVPISTAFTFIAYCVAYALQTLAGDGVAVAFIGRVNVAVTDALFANIPHLKGVAKIAVSTPGNDKNGTLSQ